MQFSKLNLMLITHDLAIGGLQQVVVNICKVIDREKFDVSVLCLRHLGEFAPYVQDMGIKVFCLPQIEGKTDYFSFFKIAKILAKEKIDIIHTHNTQPFVEGTIAALLSNVKTIVHTDHARDFPDKMRYMFAEWFAANFAHKVVGVSHHTCDNLHKFERIPLKKIQVIPNGIDGDAFNITINKKDKRKEIGIRETGPVIGLGVRFSKQKGLTYLLKAMPELIECFPDISLVIAGKGELENELRQEINDLGIENNVFIIGPRLDMAEILKLFDLYVLPSLWEGLPMVLLEAMAANIPIIATDVGGNSTAISNGNNGVLVEPKNSKQLASNIKDLLLDEEKRKDYSKRSLEIFHKKFSAKTMTRAYEKLYLRK